MTDNTILTVFMFGLVLGGALAGPLTWHFGWLRGVGHWRKYGGR